MTTKTEALTFITFTPLSRGRLRCNQDGTKVKRGRTHAHRVLHTQDPRAVAKLAAARLEKQIEAAEEGRLRSEEERRERSRQEARSRFDRASARSWGYS